MATKGLVPRRWTNAAVDLVANARSMRGRAVWRATSTGRSGSGQTCQHQRRALRGSASRNGRLALQNRRPSALQSWVTGWVIEDKTAKNPTLSMGYGSVGRIRTYDQPVNSRLLYH
jgi:hypothetical protein